MDRYQRVEKPRPEIPISENEIRITSQGLIRNYISYATSLLQEKHMKEIVLKAMGQAISKTVAIAEIIKQRIPQLHQDTAISSISITDVWEPIEDGLLPVETTRHVSIISITLSPSELDNKNSPGYQAPYPVEPQMLKSYQQRQPRQAHPSNNVANEDSYGQGLGRTRGRGRGWGRRGGYGNHQDNGGYSNYGSGGYGNYQDNGVYVNRGRGGGRRGRDWSNHGDGYEGGRGGMQSVGYERERGGMQGARYDQGRGGMQGHGHGYERGNRGGMQGAGYEQGRGGMQGHGYERGNRGGAQGAGYENRGGGTRGHRYENGVGRVSGAGYERGRGGGGRGYGGGRGRMGGRSRGSGYEYQA